MRYVLGLVLALLLGASWWLIGQSSVEQQVGLSPASSSKQRPESLPTISNNPKQQEASKGAITFATGLEDLAPSLRDTEVDGGFVLDEDGHLLPSFRTRQLFDYFLSAQGEEPLAVIVARVTAYIHQQLPSGAAQEAEELLHNYLDFLAAADGLESVKPAMQPLDIGQMRVFKQEIKALRHMYFDAATQDAFFGEEDAFDAYTLSRLEVLNNEALNATEKAEKIAELTAQMPLAFEQERKELEQLSTLRLLTDELQQTGADDKALHALRSELVGEAGAKRLAELDQQRAHWQQRVEDWLAERQRILSNGNLSDEDKAEQIQELRAQRFSEQEALRVKFAER